MSYRVDNTIIHDEWEPDCICFRDVANDLIASPWCEWQGISQELTLEEFMQAVERCNLSRDKLVLRAFEDGGGIVLDYGLRHRFWIPQKVCAGWDLSKLRTDLTDRLKEELRNGTIKLKPCPFCGSEAEIFALAEHRYGGDEGFVIQCTGCHMNTASINGTYNAYKSDIIDLWNKRVNKRMVQND